MSLLSIGPWFEIQNATQAYQSHQQGRVSSNILFLRNSIAFETLRKAVQRARVVMAERFLLSADARAGMRIACAILVSRMTDSVVRKTTATIDPHNANSAQVLPLCHIFSTTAFHKAGVCVGGCAKCSRFAQLAQRLSAPQALQLA